ncbi:MAG: TonB-dependent receptor [Burkholderiales bacterium]|nr:TonB-dependent receptor [Burkholderiales bacterium]
MNKQTFRLSLLAQAAMLSLIAATAAQAQTTPTDLGAVQAGAQSDSASAKKGTAPQQALSQGSLVATQPQSIVSQQVIQNTNASTATYTDIVAITPSVTDIEPNGAGLSEASSAVGGPYIRGFKDGQYNVTFDGIPWGDSNDFTHHSTVYFMAQDLGSVVVDRGPGDASNIGPATFGGTIANLSKEPLDKPQTTLYGTIGSWNTRLAGAEFDTGVMKNYGDLRAFIDYRQITSDGALSNAGQRRGNLFIKAEKPVGEQSLLTFVAMKNSTVEHSPIGATSYPYVDPNMGTSALPGQMQALGSNYAYNSNPLSQAYGPYNYDDLQSDFEYVGLNTRIGNWAVDNKLYTYAYYHNGYSGSAPNDQACAYGTLDCVNGVSDGTMPNAAAYNTAGTSPVTNNSDGTVNLYQMYMNYRSVGDILRAEEQLTNGTLKAGAWIDHQYNSRFETSSYAGNGVYNSDRKMQDTLDQFQPYVEYAWNAAPNLIVTPGLKYAYFRRTLDAQINQGTGLPATADQTWTKLLPTLDLHYKLQPGWVVYAQAAEGFLAPNLNTFYNTNPNQAAAAVSPQKTANYQLGTTWRSDRMTLAADVYRVNDNNAVTKVKFTTGGTPVYTYGQSHFQGGEVEGTYVLGGGFSVYANASYNVAIDDNPGNSDYGQQFAGVPKHTEALALLYTRGPWDGSVVTKFIGSRYGDYASPSHPVYPFGAVALTNLNLAYTVQDGQGALPKGAKISLQVTNLFNKNELSSLAGYTYSGNIPLFFNTPPRGVMLNFSYPFN